MTTADDQPKKLNGLYMSNEAQLKALAPEALLDLNNKGYLQACYLILASMGNMQKLLNLKKNLA